MIPRASTGAERVIGLGRVIAGLAFAKFGVVVDAAGRLLVGPLAVGADALVPQPATRATDAIRPAASTAANWRRRGSMTHDHRPGPREPAFPGSHRRILRGQANVGQKFARRFVPGHTKAPREQGFDE